MLETVGAKSLGALMAETLPSSIRQKAPLDLGTPLSETEALAHMRELASQNQVFTSLIGQGYSGTILPAVIQRNILENPAWYTAYTPYQPEISQGRLEALFNFQTMICDLSGSMSPTPRCSMKPPRRRKRWRWPSAQPGERPNRSLSMRTCIRRRWRCCVPAPSRWDGI
jgi:glycine cleavage system pyridoxal-binding protein P